jgi:hypothetical protein
MFMFQNGLLATFIPEVLMVLAYVLCLIAPGSKPHASHVEQGVLVANVTTYEPQKQISGYKVSIHDFQPVETKTDTKETLQFFIEKAINVTVEPHFSTSDGLSYVDFSRPPPSQFIS